MTGSCARRPGTCRASRTRPSSRRRRTSTRCKALDAAGNRSVESNAAEVTTPAAPLTTVTFTPVADARVEDGSPSSNFGTSTKLQASGGVPKRESYLRFQLAGITGPVVGATLRMTSTTDGTKDGPALYGAGGGWSETGLAWSNRPSHDATAAHDIAAIPKGTVADYNASSLVNGNGTLNLALISTYNDNVDFGSRELADDGEAAAADRHVRHVQLGHDGSLCAGHPQRRGADPQPGGPVLGRGERQRRRDRIRDPARRRTDRDRRRRDQLRRHHRQPADPLRLRREGARRRRQPLRSEQHRGGQHAGAARQHDGDVQRGRRRARRAGPPDHQLRDVVEAARDQRTA